MNSGVAAPGAGVTWRATAAHTLLANYSGAPPTTIHPRVPRSTPPEGWVTFEAYVPRGRVVVVWGHMDGYTSYAGEKSNESSMGKLRERVHLPFSQLHTKFHTTPLQGHPGRRSTVQSWHNTRPRT